MYFDYMFIHTHPHTLTPTHQHPRTHTPTHQTPSQTSALHQASSNGQTEAVLLLLQSKADIALADSNGVC